MVSDTPHSSNLKIEELVETFSKASSRKRKSLVPALVERAEDLSGLGLGLLTSFDPESDDWAVGCLLQILQKHQPNALEEILADSPSGWFATYSEIGIDYGLLQKNLLEESFEEADRITSSNLRELAGPAAVQRGYVYYSEVEAIPGIDLVTMDRLWTAYSQGKFAFSVQSRILASLGNRYEKLWPRIGWKKDGVWTRYPNAFTWSLDAPEGHMPLVNQLRGVRLMDALLNHPSLKTRI